MPLADSVEIEERNHLPAENLIPVNDDHRLASPLALSALLRVVAEAAGYSSHAAPPRHNQIKVIRPYRWEGIWVFDDPAVGLDKEALVAGMPELIEIATAKAGIAEPEKGFVALFSKDPFPGAGLFAARAGRGWRQRLSLAGGRTRRLALSGSLSLLRRGAGDAVC